MSPAQIDLLRRLIAADRLYRTRIAAGLPAHSDDRGVEIGAINGVCPATATALERAGLVDISDLPRNGSLWAFLGRVEPYDRLDD